MDICFVTILKVYVKIVLDIGECYIPPDYLCRSKFKVMFTIKTNTVAYIISDILWSCLLLKQFCLEFHRSECKQRKRYASGYASLHCSSYFLPLNNRNTKLTIQVQWASCIEERLLCKVFHP